MKKNCFYSRMTYLFCHSGVNSLSVTRWILLVLFAFLLPLSGVASPLQEIRITIQQKNVPLSEVFKEIEEKTDYSFLVRNNDVNTSEKVSIDAKNRTVAEVLGLLFDGKGIKYEVNSKRISVYKTVRQQSSGKRKVTGQITDNANESIIGASVFVMGTSNGTVTDIDGNFSLEVSDTDAKLQISYIGYKTQVVNIGSKVSVNVVLVEDSKTLDEVVVVGYGTQKKVNLTGSLTTVDMDELAANRPLTTVSDVLQGSVPGLVVSSGGNAPGTGKSFRLRGAYSLGIQNSDGSYGAAVAPLVLIDNVEGSMDLLNPEDIENVTVLKDAASTAIYGARAAGGVILITTKRPKEKTRFNLNYNNNFAFGKAVNLPEQAPLMDYLNAYQDAGFGDVYWSYGSPSISKWKEYLAEYRQNPSAFNIVGDGIYKDADGGVYYLNEHDRFSSFMETSFQQTHNLSVSGGTEKLRYRLSVDTCPMMVY